MPHDASLRPRMVSGTSDPAIVLLGSTLARPVEMSWNPNVPLLDKDSVPTYNGRVRCGVA